jgi:hypothetical protein
VDDLYDSFLRLTYDPDGIALVLLDYGDAMWGPVELDGSQIIQITSLIRAAGVKATPRGNEQHTLRFALCRIEDSLQDAFAARINGIIALPRTMADVLVELADGRKWRLKNAAVQAWNGGQTERLSRENVELLGGQLITDAGSYTPADYWNTDPGTWES